MTKVVIAYILLSFGVVVAIIGTIFYLRMYKAMVGSNLNKKIPHNETENQTDVE